MFNCPLKNINIINLSYQYKFLLLSIRHLDVNILKRQATTDVIDIETAWKS